MDIIISIKNDRRPECNFHTPQFEYRGLDVVQLRFLRLHSDSATQSISLKCPKKPSPAAERKDTTKRVLHLRGDSNEEIHPSHVIISQHDCEVRSNLW